MLTLGRSWQPCIFTFLSRNQFSEASQCQCSMKVAMESFVLLLVFSLCFIFIDGFEIRLDGDSPSEADRGLCCLLYNTEATCASSCRGRSCSETCQTSCGVLNSQCGSWTCGTITAACSLPDTSGSLIMVGGNLQEENTEIWSRMVTAAGGQGVSSGQCPVSSPSLQS